MSTDGQQSDEGNPIGHLDQLPIQELRCHRIETGHRNLSVRSADQVADDWADGSSEIWIDIRASHPDEFRLLLERLQLHPLIEADCLDPHRSSRFSSYDTSLHFELPVFTDDADQYLSVICVPRLLVTIHVSPIVEIDRLMQDLVHRTQLNEGSKAALMYAILDALTDRLVEAAGRSREELRKLSRSMDSRPELVKAVDIVAVKRRVQDIATIAEDQQYCIGALVAVDSEAFPISNQRDYLRDAARSYESAMRVLHRYESRAAELQQQCQSFLQARTDSRIRVLTVLSSICMPLTLIAGVYGMNFSRMPELELSWGYPATLIAMLFIALGQVYFFYRRGWFR